MARRVIVVQLFLPMIALCLVQACSRKPAKTTDALETPAVSPPLQVVSAVPQPTQIIPVTSTTTTTIVRSVKPETATVTTSQAAKSPGGALGK